MDLEINSTMIYNNNCLTLPISSLVPSFLKISGAVQTFLICLPMYSKCPTFSMSLVLNENNFNRISLQGNLG